ncbi:uncharacterized protein [Asterias amurensis]|uniref:uncharacterized protein n=1 Tax=Asterias amurensis TaxID=7602 RepID=UPI003AB4BA3B
MSIHVAHPSVRMKGTEVDWTPLHCMDSECSYTIKGPHLHCPFCTLETMFNDQLILKAHYRVKHVDKAIEFAGLKILRCCRMCDVHGIIHQFKHFKGAHWHCYHCHNGFNRRDEAMKHYKQHFRNPQTTLQIVVAQDVNQTMASYTSQVANSTSLESHLIVQSMEGRIDRVDTSPGYEENSGQQIECVGSDVPSQSTDNGEETIVLIEIPEGSEKEDIGTAACFSEHSGAINLTLLQEKERLQKQLQEERRKWNKTEQKMKDTIERLRAKVKYFSNTNTALKQQLTAMHSSSLKRLTNGTVQQSMLQELVQHLSEEHTQLLHHHLAQLRLYAEVGELSKTVSSEEESVSTADGDLVPADLGSIQSQNIQGIMMMPTDSVSTLENMEQTVVMTITSENDLVESQVEGNIQTKDSLSELQNDVQMLSNDDKVSYELSASGLSSTGNTCDSANTPQEFDKHKRLKLILSDGTAAKIFSTASLDKRSFEDDVPSGEPPLKRGRTRIFKVN